MPTKPLPPPRPRRPSTPTERGDTDLAGTGSAYAQDRLPREPVRGQRRENGAPPEVPPAGLRGVDDGNDG